MPLRPHRSRPRAGFSMIEMIFAVSITVLVFSIAIPFFRAQTRAIDAGAGRLDAFQSARYAVARIEADLRSAAGEVGQPVIVQAAPFALAFNANRQGRTPTIDPNASSWDATLDTLTTQSWMVSQARALANSSVTYPTSAYRDANDSTSKAETIQYFLHADTSGATGMYVLYRRVNNKDSTLVTSNLYVASDSNFFFQYLITGATGATSTIANSSLPVYWNDANGRADSITAVRVRATGQYWDTQARANVFRQLFVTIKLRNALRLLPRNCGAVPAAPSALTVKADSTWTNQKRDVRLDWTGVAGDSTAPRDVRQYLLFRRLSGASSWSVIGTKPARGSSRYQFQDFAIPDSGTYQYGIAARDCSGLSAVRTGSATVTFP